MEDTRDRGDPPGRRDGFVETLFDSGSERRDYGKYCSWKYWDEVMGIRFPCCCTGLQVLFS